LNFILKAFQFDGLARRQRNRRAMRGKHPRELPAQPLRGAGNENDFFTDVEYTSHDEFLEIRKIIDTDDFCDRKPDSLTNVGEYRTFDAGGELSSMNSFDAVVYLGLVIAVVTGFNAGLLRSSVTILAYLVAMPIAAWIMSLVSPQIDGKFGSLWAQNSLLFFGIFLITGVLLGKLMRMALDETIGSEAGIGDRLAGAVLGAVRVGLVAITLVLIFDQLVPTDRQPAYLTGSQLRPLLSAAGQSGFRSLPPEVAAYIDRLKQDRRI
jgi:membrane protein required for colicin V production